MPPPTAGRSDPPEAERGPPRYAIFGQVLKSDFPFVTPLAEGRGDPDLVFSAAPAPLPAGRWRELRPLYRSALRSPEGRAVLDLYDVAGGQVLRCGGVVDFYLGEAAIGFDLLDPEHPYLVELRLLGPVFAYWLESRGLPALHAAAVDTGRGAVAFLSGNRSGKTTLAAALMRRGHALLSDDVLPVDERRGVPTALPGYPQMRMWPPATAALVPDLPRLERVHPRHDKVRVPVGGGGFGTFHDRALPLSCLYLPRRAEEGVAAGVEIETLSPADALVELVRGSFAPHLVAAAGLQPARLERLARLAERVPVRRLRYPSGFERLDEVAEAALRDLERR